MEGTVRQTWTGLQKGAGLTMPHSGAREGGFAVEIVGEIVQMIEIGLEKGKKKGAIFNEKMARSVTVVAGARTVPAAL